MEICWSELEADLLCHELAPALDIDTVSLLRLHLPADEVEQQLAADELSQRSLDGYVQYPTSDGETCARLSSFSFFETMINLEREYVASDERSYLLVFATGTTLGTGARSMLFLEPAEDSDNERADAATGCGMLDFTADLAAAEPVPVPARGPWPMDWRGLTKNGLGNTVWSSGIDRALVSFYAGRTLAELEAAIFDLETSATELYEIALVSGKTTELALARERTTGEAFSGFERDEPGVWLFGLLCSSCQNPAPVLLSVLEPMTEDA